MYNNYLWHGFLNSTYRVAPGVGSSTITRDIKEHQTMDLLVSDFLRQIFTITLK